MTSRSIIIGMLGAITLCATGYFNDEVMDSTFLVGNHLPISIYGGLILFVLVVNPLLARLRRAWALSGREIAVVLVLLLAACFVPGRGLGKNWSAIVMLPWQHVRTNPGWQGEQTKLEPDNVRDWPSLIAGLRSGGDPPDLAALREHIRARMPATLRDRLENVPAQGPVDKATQSATLDALNVLIDGPSLFRPPDVVGARLPAHVRHLTHGSEDVWSDANRRRLNRGLLDLAFSGPLVSRRAGPLESAPPHALCDVSEDQNRVLDGYVTGLATGDEWISPGGVPWHAWAGPLLVWIPLVFTVTVGLIGLAAVVHRQWAEHEHLPYPIVTFTRALLPGAEGQVGAFRERSFWIPGGLVFAIVLNNYACHWWPELLIPIRTRLDFSALAPLLPNFIRGGGGWMLSNLHIYFTGIGIAYLLASDVSFSTGVGPFLYLWFAGLLAGHGISLSVSGAGGRLSPSLNGFMCAGAYVAILLVLLWTGRHYYLTVLKRGVMLRTSQAAPDDAVWGMRLLLVASLLAALQLVLLGLGWPLALAYIGVTLATQLVMGRLIAEAGVFYMLPTFTACSLLLGSFGANAIGPSALLIMQLATAVLMIDPSAAAMPFLVTGNGLAAEATDDLRRTSRWCALVVAVGIMVAIPVTIYLQYQGGATQVNGWVYNRGSTMVWDANADVRMTLAAQDALLEAETLAPRERFLAVAPNWACLGAFLAMAAIVLALAALRLRLAWWPLHPLMFAVWGTWHARPFAFSLLLGCLIKMLISKYGGARAYQKLKPCMLGLIAGELAGAIIPMIIGAVYYFATGRPPVSFRVRP